MGLRMRSGETDPMTQITGAGQITCDVYRVGGIQMVTIDHHVWMADTRDAHNTLYYQVPLCPMPLIIVRLLIYGLTVSDYRSHPLVGDGVYRSLGPVLNSCTPTDIICNLYFRSAILKYLLLKP